MQLHIRVVRKRLARERDRDAAMERARAADATLRDKLVEAAGGNVQPGAGIDDVSPIRAAMQLVDIDTIATAVLALHDRKLSSSARPATSWRDEALLTKIAQLFTRQLIPRLVSEWSKARAPLRPADALQASPAGAGCPGARKRTSAVPVAGVGLLRDVRPAHP
jgi:hypothetical protein